MNKLVVKRIFSSCLMALLLVSGIADAAIWQVDTLQHRTASIDVGSRFISDESELRRKLNTAPDELSGQSIEIKLPMPDGSLARFKLFESSVMAPELSEKFPQIKSYKVYGVDDPVASGRVDLSPKGFRGMLFTSQGRVYIDPATVGSSRYLVRRRGDIPGHGFQCGVLNEPMENQSAVLPKASYASRIPGSLRQYRLAVSATSQYVAAVNSNGPGNELDDAISEINTAINRVNEIFERDLGIRLALVANNDLIVDLGGGTLSQFNDDDTLLLEENQSWIDSKLGNGNYDIGHVFSTEGGGSAQLESVCKDNIKAEGVTGSPDPTSDLFYIDFVAHEIGHQFGAEHTFNGTSGSCGNNRSFRGISAFEPGSGSTIMAYAGICGSENIQFLSDATFHAGSIDQINNFVGGLTCHSTISAGNANEPSVNASSDRSIPIQTAFRLEANASDVDGDTLSYQWDQMDAGTATTATTLGDDLNNNALFRTYEPFTQASRDFPALGTQLDNLIDLSESLPCVNRALNFRLTVRDGKSGQATDNVRLTVVQNAGPFMITSHNTGETILIDSGEVTLTWDVADTDLPPVSCNNVDIDLLTFSSDDSSYAVTSLLNSTANNGSALITLPDMSSTRARFRVACSDNIFYDISDTHLTIQDSGTATVFLDSGNSTFVNTDGQVFAAKGQECVGAVPDGSAFGNVSGSGGGSPHPLWLLSLLMLVSAARYYKNSLTLRAYIEF